MSGPHLAKLATDLLAREEMSRADDSASREAEVARAIAERIRARSRRRRTLRVAGGLALAATVILAIGRLTRPAADAPAKTPPSAEVATLRAKAAGTPSSASVVRGAVASPLDPGAPIAAGDRVDVGEAGSATLELSDGSRVRTESRSELRVESLAAARRFVLTRGSMRADVHKLGAGERFVVATGDAEVEVHGTSFQVAVAEAPDDCASTRTRVHVFEGVVAVRGLGGETKLYAGEDWPATCPTTARAPSRSADAGLAVAPPSSPGAAPSASPRPAPAPEAPPSPVASAAAAPGPHGAAPPGAPPREGAPSTALAEQNRLFAEATAARRRGDAAAAIAAYERLVARHPGGSLAEAAAVERMRLLAQADRPRAREAARAYLARHPNGYARAEAEHLVR
jgi:hypothetical protein